MDRSTPTSTQPNNVLRAKRPADINLQAQSTPLSPLRQPYPSTLAASPSRLRSSSPRLSSPASSEIFERNVQEPVPMSTLQSEMSPAHIPTHVMTEDHIPPALEASAQAITSNSLNADEVEIVMSSAHQLAGGSVLDGSHADLSQVNSPALPQRGSEVSDAAPLQSSGLLPPSQSDEDGGANATNSYGQLDPNDVRRLSFISFADVVQSEHNELLASTLSAEPGNRESLHLSNLPSITSTTSEGPTSPLRSPASTISGAGLATPPPGAAASDPMIKHSEQSPTRSPISGVSQHGDLTIETMRQAVRKTASGDLGAAGRSSALQALTPVVSTEDALAREARSRTNS